MKKLILLTSAVLLGGFIGMSTAQAQVNELNEPGSLLVYPLIDNINFDGTIVEVTNGGSMDVVLECNMVTHGAESTTIDEKKDFFIKLSPKEKFWWNTATSYDRVNKNKHRTQLAGFDGRKGYMFCWAVDGDLTRQEIDYDYLRGEALPFSASYSFAYNAIPSQGLAVVADRVLNLDGVEYTMATSRIFIEGLAAGAVPGLDGTLAITNIGIDFLKSTQPEFDINASCWNQDETRFSRHIHYKDFMQVAMSGPFQVRVADVFTPGFNCQLDAGTLKGSTKNAAMWAVYYTNVGRSLAAGNNVWQDPATGVATTVILSN